MYAQLNKACCRLYQAFAIKSATYLTNLSFIKKINKSISDMVEIFTTVGSIELYYEKVYTYYKNYRYINNEFSLILRFRHKKYNIGLSVSSYLCCQW